MSPRSHHTTTSVHRPGSLTVNVPSRRRARALRAPSRRTLGLVATAAALLGSVPVAHGATVTNPADHPYPITVTIDGQTYHDGQDTLPGFDDTACTAIPNVLYDFANNQIQYYDDDGNLLATADWTEWDRNTAYATWVKQQSAASSSGTKSTSSTSTGTTSSAGSTSSGAATTTTQSSGSTGQATTSAATSAPSTSSASTATASPSTSTASTSGSATTSAASTSGSTTSKSSGSTKKSSSKGSDASSPGSTGSSISAPTATAASGAAAATAATGGSKSKKAAAADGTTPPATSPDGTTPAAVDPSTPEGAVQASLAGISASLGGGGGPTDGSGQAGTAANPAAAQADGVKVKSGVPGGAGNTRVAGLLILAALAGFGLLVFFGGFARRQALSLRRPAEQQPYPQGVSA